MARTDLDRALLGEDLTSEVTLRNVASLSPVQLAVVASRDDLDRQVQTRACTTFVGRKAAFDAAGGSEDPSQGLFALPLDTQLPDRIEDLSPTDLALAPLNAYCTDGGLLERAALRFRQLAAEYQGRPSTQLPSPLSSPSLGHTSSPTSSTRPRNGGAAGVLAAGSCSFSWGDEVARTVGPVEVKLQEDEIVIAFRNQPLFNILASKLCLFLFLEGETHGQHQEMTVQLEAYDAIMEGTTRLRPSFNLRLSLGMTHHDALSTLVTAVEGWRERFEFQVSHLPATPTPSEGFTHIPPSPVNITLEHATSSTHARAPDVAPDDATHARGLQAGPDEGGTAQCQPLSAPTLRPSKLLSGPFRYLGRSPAPPAWTAGFWVRLFAILQAVCPQAGLSCPDFTREEIRLLSRRADAGKLPDLPDKPFPRAVRHAPPDRLGLEEIYRARDKITLDQCRNVLFTTEYPELRKYAQTMGKIVKARDAFFEACSYIVRQDSAIKHLDSPCKMPRKHLELVRDLRDSEVHRMINCTEQNLRLIRTSKFAPNELEPSAHRRFEAALEEIVRVEDAIQGEAEDTR